MEEEYSLRLSVRRAAELPAPHAEPTFMSMPDTVTPVYWTADMARRHRGSGISD